MSTFFLKETHPIGPEFDICIVGGLGHIGLPLGILFADCGKKVVLYDINQKAIDIVSRGRMPFVEEGAEEVLKRVLNKTLSISNDRNAIGRSGFIIIVIGTPVDEYLNPKFTLLKKFFDDISELLKNDQHIVLRSTVFPGTTGVVRDHLAGKGLRPKLSFCPERIAQGKAMEELRKLPQIISAFDDISLREARGLFSLLADDIVELSPMEAELAKLFTNSWRYIQFAISNQFYQLSIQQGLDFYRIYDAITYKYPRAASFPRAGFSAGPCLFKDTMQLAAYNNNNFFLGHAAMLVNEGLPNFIVQKLKEKYPLREKTVGILGMTFKPNNDDIRDSLSFKLKKLLEVEAGRVLCSDPYFSGGEGCFVPADSLVRDSDIIVLATPHKHYGGLDLNGKAVVDICNFRQLGGLF